MAKPLSTSAPSEQAGAMNIVMAANMTNVRQRMDYPSGVVALTAMYADLAGGTPAAGQYGRLVLNAASDADADGKLSIDGGYIPVFKGLPWSTGAIESYGLITRVDYRASVASTGESTQFALVAGVRT